MMKELGEEESCKGFLRSSRKKMIRIAKSSDKFLKG